MCCRNNMKIFFKNTNIHEEDLRKLEIGIYNYTLEYAKKNGIPLSWKSNHFKDIYEKKSLSIYQNIDNGNINFEFMKAEDIAYMAPEQLKPSLWTDLINKNKEKIKNSYEIHMLPMSDRIVCRKCKSRDIVYYEYQSRKADEGSSTAYTCLNCNYKWKKN